MVELNQVIRQLRKVGYRNKFWQRSEVKELCNVLHDTETIIQATNGYYDGGMALLVATDTRLILIDHKPMFLTLDSIAYPMVQEIAYNYRLLNSTLHIFTSNRCLDFSSWNHSQIREILKFAQTAMKDKGGMTHETIVRDGSNDGRPIEADNNQTPVQKPVYAPQYIQTPRQPAQVYYEQPAVTDSTPLEPHYAQPIDTSDPYYSYEPVQPSLTPAPNSVSDSLANLVLSQNDIQPEPRLTAVRTPSMVQS